MAQDFRAYLGVPIRAEGPEHRLPCIVTAPGSGGSQQGVMLDDCQRGFAVLRVYPRSQGESADLWKIDGPNKLTGHLDTPEGYYYQGACVDVIHGIDYLRSRPDIDASRVGAMGTSQGGGIVLAVGALGPRVKAVAAHVPFLCDMRRAAFIPGALVKTLLDRYARMLRTPDYFDPAILVDRFRSPVLSAPEARMPSARRKRSDPFSTVYRYQVDRVVSLIAAHGIGRLLQNGLGMDGPPLGKLSLKGG